MSYKFKIKLHRKWLTIRSGIPLVLWQICPQNGIIYCIQIGRHSVVSPVVVPDFSHFPHSKLSEDGRCVFSKILWNEIPNQAKSEGTVPVYKLKNNLQRELQNNVAALTCFLCTINVQEWNRLEKKYFLTELLKYMHI